VTTATVCFKRKSNICIAKFGNLGANGVKGSKFLVENWNRRPYSLCNFYGATMMIKGSLLLSAPLLSIFRRKKCQVQCVLGQNLTVLRDKYGFNIKFKFYDAEKAHPCVISHLMSYRA